MAQKPISFIQLSDTLSLAEMRDGFWLYDKTRGMNLAMRAKTSNDAFVEALHYYQKRLKETENSYASLKAQVDNFVNQFVEKEEDDGS